MNIILYFISILFVFPRIASGVAVISHTNQEQLFDKQQTSSPIGDVDTSTIPDSPLHPEPTISGSTPHSPIEKKIPPHFEIPRSSGTFKFRRPRTRIHSFDNSETIRYRVTSTITEANVPIPTTWDSESVGDDTNKHNMLQGTEQKSEDVEDVAAVVAEEVTIVDEEAVAVMNEESGELEWYVQDPVWYVQDAPKTAAVAPPPPAPPSSHSHKPHGQRDPKIWWSTGLGPLGLLFRPKPKHHHHHHHHHHRPTAATTSKPDYQPVLVDEEYDSNGNVLMKVYFILAITMICYCAFVTTRRNRNKRNRRCGMHTSTWRKKQLHDVEKAHYEHTPTVTAPALHTVEDQSKTGYHWIMHNFHNDEDGNLVCEESESPCSGVTLVDTTGVSPENAVRSMGSRRWTYGNIGSSQGKENMGKKSYGALGKSNSMRVTGNSGNDGGGRRRAVTWSKGGDGGDELD